MPSSSGTYNFQSVAVELLIREAYENIGISPDFIEPQKLDSARRSLNLLLLDWMNKSVNLWTLKSAYLSIKKGKGQYILPDYLNDITQVNLRTSSRMLNGAPTSSNAGVAVNAFDDNDSTACTQDAPDGNISYDYGEGNAQSINFIGVTSNSNTRYSLIIEYSTNNADWQELQIIEAQNFQTRITIWFDILAPMVARAYRIRETGGATLNISEIYFNNNVLDMPISNVSRYEYLTYPNKNLEGRPSIYYLDRGMDSVLNIWPTPSVQYNCLQYSYEKVMQDVGLYTKTIEIPSVLYPTAVLGLSFKLALKFNPEMADMLRAEYEQSFNIVDTSYSEDVAISINKPQG